MINMARIVKAPTDRSMPAVRITKVCPMASAAITATCWSTSEMLPAVANRGLITEKTTNAMIRTRSGLIEGCECSTC